MSISSRQELVALELIVESQTPVGAARLETAWRSEGIHKGEATAGRFLRQLDQAGYTLLLGRTRGRILSDKGQQRLQELRRAAITSRAEQDLQRALDVSSTEDLLELLQVRKLVECETVRRAAAKATEDEIANLISIATRCCAQSDEDSTRESMDFHREIARLSHSPLLIAVMNLLLDPVKDPLERALSKITRSSGLTQTLQSEHEDIARLISARKPEEAAQLMAKHFDTLISAGENFSSTLPT